MYPNWRFISYPDEGELVAHVRWTDVLDLVEQALGSSRPGPASHATLTARTENESTSIT
jgi:hypothetical protein